MQTVYYMLIRPAQGMDVLGCFITLDPDLWFYEQGVLEASGLKGWKSCRRNRADNAPALKPQHGILQPSPVSWLLPEGLHGHGEAKTPRVLARAELPPQGLLQG